MEKRESPLTQARKAKNLSQEQLARALGLKSKGYVCDLESGAAVPSERTAIALYRALGVKIGPVADLSDREIRLLEKLKARQVA